MANLPDWIEVEEPCSESWEEMRGNSDVRFCSHCAQNVHDLTSMTPKRAEAFVRQSEGRLCIRYIKPQTNIVEASTLLTQITRRATVAAGFLAGTLALSGATAAQIVPTSPAESLQCSEWAPSLPKQYASDLLLVSGVVRDQMGAVIPAATAKLIEAMSGYVRCSVADAYGEFSFRDIERGDYELIIEAPYFKRSVFTNLHITENIRLEQEIVMEVAETTTGIVAIAEPEAVPRDIPPPTIEPRPRPLQVLLGKVKIKTKLPK